MEILERDTYLAMIQNAVGARLFQNLYAKDGEGARDILRGGALSCAFFVSSILHHFNLVKAVHATVSGTVGDMETKGWTRTNVYEEGAVLVWKEREKHTHVGFYVGGGRAISNNPEGDTPLLHSVDFNGTRAVEAIYTHRFLKQ